MFIVWAEIQLGGYQNSGKVDVKSLFLLKKIQKRKFKDIKCKIYLKNYRSVVGTMNNDINMITLSSISHV